MSFRYHGRVGKQCVLVIPVDGFILCYGCWDHRMWGRLYAVGARRAVMRVAGVASTCACSTCMQQLCDCRASLRSSRRSPSRRRGRRRRISQTPASRR